MRLSKTVDLTATSAATAPKLQFQLSINTEPAYDHVIVEAHTVGQNDWTTLPDMGGAHADATRRPSATTGFLLALHPFLRHYLGGPDCRAAGHDRDVELVHRLDRRLVPGLVRPVGVRRQAGRGLDQLRHRSGRRRRRRVRRRHAVRHHGRARSRRTASRARRARWTIARPAGRQPAERGRLEIGLRSPNVLRRHVDRRHAAAGLRPRAGGHARRRTALVKQALGGLGVR